jgi:uncharacterized protein (DUF952 family)
MTHFIYKLFRQREWQEAVAAGAFYGSADDKRDGFLHFSAAHQVRATFDKYFSAEENPVLAAIDADRLGEALKWELSRGGEKFPHLYGVLKLAELHSVHAIAKGASGRPIFPPEIP